jgi:tetratricopeptide (TPR) repeat protein
VEKVTRQNRVKEALGKIYDNYPPYFREYLRRFKEDPTSRVFAPLAEAYRRLGRVEEAIEIALEGLEHHPDFHGGRVTLAKCYIDKKKYSEAKAALEMISLNRKGF